VLVRGSRKAGNTRAQASARTRRCRGQSLVETVLLMPLLLGIILNAVNFAYFFLMALNITASSRTSAIYSIMGSATPAAIAYPKAGDMTGCSNSTASPSVSCLAYLDLTGAVYSPSSIHLGGQVCSPSVGVLNAGTLNQKSQCQSFGLSGAFPAADVDPEPNSGNTAPAFLLNRVDVVYKFTPPIPPALFNLIVLASPACSTSPGGDVTCTFYRHIVMRAM
jgi:hypothetical protein